MSIVTVIKYDVLEHILRDWLWSEFGTAATYEAASESGAGYWKVTATREITQQEQEKLKIRPLKKRRTLRH